jgi:UDP-N-acetylmuramate--alanine ligase
VTREAAAIGAGLRPARAARKVPAGERIHVVGIAGAGASAAAILAQRAGAVVSGCDPGGPSPYTPAVVAAGIPIEWSHDAGHVEARPAPDRLAVTKALTAIDPDHPELVAARGAGIPIEPWQQVVADVAAGRVLIGVAGTHGKSTSAGWLVHTLVAAGADPSAFVGALLPPEPGAPPSTARWGAGSAFVVEADEYAGNFDPYRPDIAIVTSIEWDHPDVFADRAAVVTAFEGWVRRMPSDGTLIVNAADDGGAELARRCRETPRRIILTALVGAESSRVGSYRRGLELEYGGQGRTASALVGRIGHAGPDGTVLELHGEALGMPRSVRLPTAGRHNAANAIGVVAAAVAAGADVEAILAGVAAFPGVGRRLERKGEAGGVVVYDDYGHHPTAIRETIAAMRQREPGRRLWAVYEPLTYHRTAALLERFADALALADAVAVADIWAGRDPDTTVASARGLADAVARLRADIPVFAPGTVEATAEQLAAEVRPGDAVLVMGGGRSYRIGEMLLERLEATP